MTLKAVGRSLSFQNCVWTQAIEVVTDMRTTTGSLVVVGLLICESYGEVC